MSLVDSTFSAKGFYKNLEKGELSVPQCKLCKSFVIPPTSVCSKCLSTELEWVTLCNKGKVVSYSEILVSNSKFQARIPYVVSIIETEKEGVRLPGIIKNATASQLKVGIPVSIIVDPKDEREPAYFFVLDE
jgi:uncharacterized OB-fold protein